MIWVATCKASLRKPIGVGPACASMPVTVQSYQDNPSTPGTTPMTLSASSSTGPCSICASKYAPIAWSPGSSVPKYPMRPSSSATVLPSVTLAAYACSSEKAPQNTPDPIMTGTKRDPPSLVQNATSIGDSVSI